MKPMFEHLGQQVKVEQKLAVSQLLALGILMVSGFSLAAVLVIKLSAQLRPAPLPGQPHVQLVLDDHFSQPRYFVGDQADLPVLNLFLTTDRPLRLKELTVQLAGLFQPDNFGSFKFYFNNSQVGRDSRLDQNGQLSFIFDELTLPAGQQILSLTSDWQVTGPGQNFTVSLAPAGLKLEANDQPLPTPLIKPLVTALTSFRPAGELLIYNQIVSGEHGLVTFESQVLSQAEAIDLKELTLDWQASGVSIKSVKLQVNDKTLELASQLTAFDLLAGHWLANQAQALDLKLLVTTEPQAASGQLNLNWRLTGQGVNSGQDISRSLASPTVYFVPERLTTTVLTDDRQAYTFSVSSASGRAVDLQSLTLAYQATADITDWQLDINGKLIKTSWQAADGQVVLSLLEPFSLASRSVIKIRPQADQGGGEVALYLAANGLIYQPTGAALWLAEQSPTEAAAAASRLRL